KRALPVSPGWPPAVSTTHTTGNSKDARRARCCRPAPPWRLNDCRLGASSLDAAGGCTTISTPRLSQSRAIAGLSRRRTAAGLFRSGIWRTRWFATTPTRGHPTPAWRRDGLATRVLELEQTRLGVGVLPLCLPPVRARQLGSRSLDPTTRGLGL